MLRRLLFHNFRTVYHMDQWFRQRFTVTGMLIFGVTIASAVFGIDTRKTFSYQLFSLTASMLLLSLLFSLWFRSRFEFKRELPPFGTVGEPLHYQIELHNINQRPQLGLALQEYLEGDSLNFATFSNAIAPTTSGNWFDNYVGYPRWVWLMRQRRGADSSWQEIPPMPPQQSLKIRAKIAPRRRGYVHFRRLMIARPDPLGLFRALQILQQTDSVLILPKRYAVPHVDLPGSRRYQAGGVNLAMSVGDAVEFVSLREYRPGDALRHIHWKSWAKQGKPIVKEFQDEFFVRHALVLDTFCTAEQLDEFEEAISVAASFVGHLTTQDTLLDLMFVGTETYRFTGGRGLGHVEKMLEILACVEPCNNKSFDSVAPLLLQHAHELSGCIFVLLSWDEKRQTLLNSLQRYDVPLLALIISENTLNDLPDYCHVLHMGQIEKDLLSLS